MYSGKSNTQWDHTVTSNTFKFSNGPGENPPIAQPEFKFKDMQGYNSTHPKLPDIINYEYTGTYTPENGSPVTGTYVSEYNPTYTNYISTWTEKDKPPKNINCNGIWNDEQNIFTGICNSFNTKEYKGKWTPSTIGGQKKYKIVKA